MIFERFTFEFSNANLMNISIIDNFLIASIVFVILNVVSPGD